MTNFINTGNNSVVNAKDYGAVGNGTTDDTIAIQSALTNAAAVGSNVLLPAGTYAISAPLQIVTGNYLTGATQKTTIVTLPGFSGDALIELIGGAGGCERFYIADLKLQSSSLTAWAIKLVSILGTNGIIERIDIETSWGISLNTYAQSMTVRDILFVSDIQQLLVCTGNHNLYENLDKEGGGTASTSSDPYIYLCGTNYLEATSVGSTFRKILIEGVCSVNKPGIVCRNAEHVNIENTWMERPNGTNPYGFIFDNCHGFYLRGYQYGISNEQIIQCTNSWGNIELLDLTFDDSRVDQVLSVDSTSSVYIDTALSRVNRNAFPLASHNIHVSSFRNGDPNILPASITGRSELHRHGSNLFLANPSFEAGYYGWTYYSQKGGTNTAIASTVSCGLMAHIVTGVSVDYEQLQQSVTIPTDLVGASITFTAMVRASGATGAPAVIPLISGCGITYEGGETYNAVNVVMPTGDWQIFSATVVPQTAGALSVGFEINVTSVGVTVDIDECCLSVGDVGQLNPGRFVQVELNNSSFTSLAAFPTTGTWKLGDVCFNSVPTSGGTPGWVCVTAGSPGAWMAMANLVPANSFVDGNMEASGMSIWQIMAGSAAKTTSTPHLGSQCMRINAGSLIFQYSVSLFPIANFTIHGWARGDGTSTPCLAYGGSGAHFWTGTSSTSWQYFSVSFLNDAASYSCMLGAVGGSYSDFDDVYISINT
jgi:hypothetical protein